jgi:peptidoglycan/LPS O-acetylase OafA/YrhL
VGWTLRIEAIFSLLLPLVFVFARPAGGLPLLALAAAALAVPGLPRWLDHALDFSLGVVTFQQRARLARWLGRVRGWRSALFVVMAAALHAGPLLLGWLIPFDGPWVVEPRRGLSLGMTSIGAWGLVLAALFLPAPARLLSRAPLVASGRISYSLYLFHLPVIQLLLWAWDPQARLSAPQAIGLVALVVGVSWVVSWIAWEWIEHPSIQIGNRFCARIGRMSEPESVTSASMKR